MSILSKYAKLNLREKMIYNGLSSPEIAFKPHYRNVISRICNLLLELYNIYWNKK